MVENTGAEVTPAEDGMKLMRFLERRLEDVPPKALLQKWIRTGQVRINKKRAKPFAVLCAGDVVRVPPFAALRPVANMGTKALLATIPGAVPDTVPGTIPDTTADESPSPILCTTPGADRGIGDTRREAAPRPIYGAASGMPPCTVPCATPVSCTLPFSIIAATSDLLVMNKPAGLPVQPGSGVHESLSGALAAVYAHQPFIPAPAHRIDRHTSGIVLAGLTHAMQRQLHTWFAEEGGIGKEYLTWVALYEDGATRLADAGLLSTPESFCCQNSTRPLPDLRPFSGPQLSTGHLPDLEKPVRYENTETPETLEATESAPKVSGASASDSRCRQDRRGVTPAPIPDMMPVVLLEDLLAKLTLPGGQEKMQVVQDGGLMAKSQAQLLYCIPYRPDTRDTLRHRVYGSHQSQAIPKAAALIHIQLLTGRTHQIRVQLASRGLPIIGDGRYGGPVHMPMLLHAWRVILPDNRHFSALPDWASPFAVTIP